MKTDEYGNEIVNTGSGSGPIQTPSSGDGTSNFLNFMNPIGANQRMLESGYQNAQNASQDKSAKGNLGKSISNAAGATGNMALHAIPAALEDAMIVAGFKGASTVGKGIGMVAKYPTKKGLAAATDAAAAEGKYLPWDQAKQTITNNVFNGKNGTGGLLNTQANQQALKNIFNALEKNGIDNGSMSTLNALKGRRQIAASLPQNFLSQMFNGGKAANQVGGVVRNSLSDLVHQGAPNTMPLDKLYSMYSKVGDVPTAIKHGIVAYGGDRLGKAVGGPVGETGADILSFLKYLH